ncbi:MAG: glycosyltransferase [Alphaproteobacteria bacterium]|nr:glycosyltransferase [Alphaproteobacteria bacterium]
MTSGLAAPSRRLRIVILGLSITSSWGNGHATTYRSLMAALCRRGHEVLFLERDKPWYREHRDLLAPPFGTTRLYSSVAELGTRWRGALREADLVILGSYVPDGIEIAALLRATVRGLLAFYDIDTPVTLAALAASNCAYLKPALVPAFDLYLSFTGGPLLRAIERDYGAPAARALYCSIDPDRHRPEAPSAEAHAWALGYLGTYSPDRQPPLDSLLCEPARRWPEGRFAVAGPLYPGDLCWPDNIERMEHIAPDRHGWFYARQRFTLNVTRADMIRAGYSPSVRLFEAAACQVPIISDWWPGLDSIFRPGEEILVARTAKDVLAYLHELPEAARRAIAERARARVLAEHTAAHRAVTLEGYVEEVSSGRVARPEGETESRGAMARAGVPLGPVPTR